MSVDSQLVAPAFTRRKRLAMIASYWQLTKPRVMVLSIFTGLVGLVAAPVWPGFPQAIAAMVCLSIGAGAAGALNMWYDADIDRLMKRTQHRPLPSQRLREYEALIFGLGLAIIAVGGMALLVNNVAALLLSATIAHYLFVYTMWLKRRSAQSVVIGGVAGALPPLIGWAAATGTVGLMPLLLAAMIFLWTPPHSWALALNRHDDLIAAGLPAVTASGNTTTLRWMMLGYAILTVAASLAPVWLGLGWVYGILAGLLGSGFVILTALGAQARDAERIAYWSRLLFAYSIPYLFFLFLIFMLAA